MKKCDLDFFNQYLSTSCFVICLAFALVATTLTGSQLSNGIHLLVDLLIIMVSHASFIMYSGVTGIAWYAVWKCTVYLKLVQGKIKVKKEPILIPRGSLRGSDRIPSIIDVSSSDGVEMSDTCKELSSEDAQKSIPTGVYGLIHVEGPGTLFCGVHTRFNDETESVLNM